MPAKPKSVKETPASYRAKSKRKRASKPASKRLALSWDTIEKSTQPIILKKDGKPKAVVIHFEDYERLNEAQAQNRATTWRNLEALLAQVHARTSDVPLAEIEADITAARQEVRDQHHARRG